MGRPCSIPRELHPEIITRSTLGQTPTQIYEWLSEPDGARPAIATSRQSVLRVIEEQLADYADQARLAVVNRARLRALSAYDAFDDIAGDLVACVQSTEKEMPPEALKRLQVRLQGLSKLSMHYARQLRGAGTTGRSADQLVERWSDVTGQMREQRKAAKRTASETEESVRNSEPNSAKTLENESDTPSESLPDVSPDPPLPDAPPEVREAFESGLALSPCLLTTTSVNAAGFPRTSAAIPLTETEKAFAAGYARGWRAHLSERDLRTPGDDAKLLERTVEEMQFQKRRLQACLLRERDNDTPPPTRLEEAVILAPETPVPARYAAERQLREAWRSGLEGVDPIVEIDGTESQKNVLDIPLSDYDRAWAAGREVAYGVSEESSEARRLECGLTGSEEHLVFAKLHACAARRVQAEKEQAGKSDRSSRLRVVKAESPEVWSPP